MNQELTKNQPERDARGRLTKGNRASPGRAPGTAEKDKLRALIQPHRAAIVDHLVKAVQSGDRDASSVKAAETLLGYLSARPRPQAASVRIPGMTSDMSLTAKAELVVKAVFNGEVDPDSGRAVLAMLADAAKILEVSHLASEVEKLKAVLDSGHKPRVIDVLDDGSDLA